MKSYLSLIPISARVHRHRSRMTLFCIAISVFLVTAVFGLAETGFRMEAARLSEKHTHFSVFDLLGSAMGQTLLIVAFILFLFIMLAGVLMIAGSINSHVAERTQFFGMLRCIGMSRKQIVCFVRLEALSWCKSSIPAGLLAGTVFTWILCAILRYVVGEEFSNIPVFYVSIPGIVGGMAVGVISVLLAASAPAKRAAAVSPVVAVSGNSDAKQAALPNIQNDCLHIEIRLGIFHALAAGKNLSLMAGSFALSIILFFSFLVFVDLVNHIMPQYHNEADVEIYSDAEISLGENLAEALARIDGVKRVFGRKSALGVDAAVDGKKSVVDVISFDDFDIACLKRDHLLKFGSNLKKVYGNSRYVIATWDKTSTLRIGDRLEVAGETVEIAGLLKYDIFSSDGLTAGQVTLITSAETFSRLTGQSAYQMISVQTTREATDETIEAIRRCVGAKANVRDRRDAHTHGTYLAFMMFVYGFLATIALVAVLNIVNSISMSVSARIKEYGAMRAVGMGLMQVIRMIWAESLTYALTGCVLGCAVGMTINRVLYRVLIESHFAYDAWKLPVGPLFIVTCYILGAVALAVAAPAARIRRMAITETIQAL